MQIKVGTAQDCRRAFRWKRLQPVREGSAELSHFHADVRAPTPVGRPDVWSGTSGWGLDGPVRV